MYAVRKIMSMVQGDSEDEEKADIHTNKLSYIEIRQPI